MPGRASASGASRAGASQLRADLLYDDDCGFCRWSVAKVLAWDRAGALRPVAIQSREGERLLSDMNEEQRMASWHLVTNYGEVHSAGAAAPELLRLLPGGRPAASLTAAVPTLAERAYGLIARNRGLFGRLIGSRAERRARARIAARGGRAAGGFSHLERG